VSSALFQRTHTGKGQLVDVAMLDASLAFLSSFVADYTVGGHLQGQSGNRAQSRQPTADVFKVKGGHILLAVNNEKQFGALSRAIGLPDLAKDPRFRDWPTRVANDAALRAIIEEVFASDDDKTWEARLSKADVPCSRVWSIAEIVAHPQLKHRDVLQRVETRYGPMTVVGSGFRLAHGGGSVEREPALPGEDAEEVLGEAGYGASEIAALRHDGVI
jgi:crotonobetainyl-CoA:carnitine CoA-transferase CaiB-like acyl-CoA transferase